MFISCLNKYEKMVGSRAAWTEAIYTVICHDTLKSHKTVSIVWIS